MALNTKNFPILSGGKSSIRQGGKPNKKLAQVITRVIKTGA